MLSLYLEERRRKRRVGCTNKWHCKS